MPKLENFKFPTQEQNPEEREARRRFPSELLRKLKRFTIETILIVANLCLANFSSNYVGQQIEKRYFTPDDYIEHILKEESGLSQKKKEEIKKKVYFIATQLGDEYLQSLKEAALKAKKNEKTKELILKDWRKVGITEEEAVRLKWAILKTYPPHLLKNVEEIVFKEEFGKPPKKYNIKNPTVKQVGEIRLFKKTIFIGVDFKVNKEREKLLLLVNDIFAHELGHLNDWRNNPSLTNLQRIEFLYEILKNYNRPDTPHYSYDSKIESKNKFLEQQMKIEEWWAITCDNYFNFSYSFIKNYPKEAALVEQWLKIDRQKFDAVYNLVERADILFGRKE